MDILLLPFAILIPFIPMAAIIAIIVYNNNGKQAITQRRAEAMAGIATKLGAHEHRAEHQELIPHIKKLMKGQRKANVSNSLRFPVGNGEVILAEYSYRDDGRSPLTTTVIGSSLSSRRIRFNLVAVPILDTSKEVPLFYVQRKKAFDRLPYLRGWRRVRLAEHGEFKHQIEIRTTRQGLESAQRFFEQHPELVEFCQSNRDYHIVCNGRWLALYKPDQYLKAEIELFRNQLDLAKQLYGCIWPVEGDGKAAVFETLIDVPEDAFWSDSPKSYDDHLNSLKG